MNVLSMSQNKELKNKNDEWDLHYYVFQCLTKKKLVSVCVFMGQSGPF